MMIFINECYKVGKVYKEYALGFVKLISPIVPHLGEELWEILGNNDTIAYESWPTYDESKLVLNDVDMAVQVNGKMRGKFTIAKDACPLKNKYASLLNGFADIESKAIPNQSSISPI